MILYQESYRLMRYIACRVPDSMRVPEFSHRIVQCMSFESFFFLGSIKLTLTRFISLLTFTHEHTPLTSRADHLSRLPSRTSCVAHVRPRLLDGGRGRGRGLIMGIGESIEWRGRFFRWVGDAANTALSPYPHFLFLVLAMTWTLELIDSGAR